MYESDIKFDDFQYVVERKKPDPICFGSKVIRDTNPIGKGLSAFQKRYAGEIHTKITPQTYNIKSGLDQLRNKVRSNKGVGGLANGALRFPHRARTQIPSPTRYDPEPMWKMIKKNKIPFGKTQSEKFDASSKTPGPGNYEVQFKHCSRTKTAYNFGRPKMIPAVEEICMPVPADICNRCSEICENDYWHKNYTDFLCHMCMEEEKVLREDFTIAQLKKYQKIRTCSFKHSHEGANAAVWLMPKHKLDKVERLENYLNLFISSF